MRPNTRFEDAYFKEFLQTFEIKPNFISVTAVRTRIKREFLDQSPI